MTDAWQEESRRLFQIRFRYLRLLKQVREAKEEGIRCQSRTNTDGFEIYWLVDRDKRVLSGEYDCMESAWLSYLESAK